MQEHLGVRMGGEPVPGASSSGRSSEVIEDLAVEDDPERPVLVGRWAAGRR